MKNQNDLIISIVSIVLALILAGVFFGTKPQVAGPPAPPKVNLVTPTLPQADVVMANALPDGGNNAGGAGGGGGGLGAAPSRGAAAAGGGGGGGMEVGAVSSAPTG